jgi:hypothetical protein
MPGGPYTFNRWLLFAAMLCAAAAVLVGYVGRDQKDTLAVAYLAVIAVATAYSLLWLLGRIVAGKVQRRQNTERKE